MDSLSPFDCRQFLLFVFLCFVPTAFCLLFSRPKPLPIFSRGDERLDHFRAYIVAIEGIELVQPEVVIRKV